MNLHELIQQEANQCVKCGLCAPHCPTYNLTHDEGESPRGRIALMEGYASGKLPLTERLETYLDHCLTCLACEAVCPSEVEYDKLISQTRTLMADDSKKKKLPRSIDLAIRYPKLFKGILWLLRLYQGSLLQKIGRWILLWNQPNLHRLESFLPPLQKRRHLQNFYPAKNLEQGHVALFTGCISNLFDQKTLESTIKVLTACGYSVAVPANQNCCGALHKHAGDSVQAKKLADQNHQLFQKLGINTLISTSSGCTTTLKDSLPVKDICEFLNHIVWPDQVTFKPLAKRIVLHTPCTLRNGLHLQQEPFKLLSHIPNLEVIPLSSAQHCCGAAGIYMLQQPEIADTLAKNILKQAESLQPDYFVTTNIGCSLHLSRTLREIIQISLPIIHPVTLLAQQLE